MMISVLVQVFWRLASLVVAFFCMVVMPLIGAAVMVVVLAANWSNVCQILLSVSSVTIALLCTVATVGFKYALSTDNVSVRDPNCNDVQCPSQTNALSSTAVPTAEACPNDTNTTLEQSSMLVGDDSSDTEYPNTENASTDLYETCSIALFFSVWCASRWWELLPQSWWWWLPPVNTSAMKQFFKRWWLLRRVPTSLLGLHRRWPGNIYPFLVGLCISRTKHWIP